MSRPTPTTACRRHAPSKTFRISDLRAPADLVTATILIKKAAAEANRDLGRLDAVVANAIVVRRRRDSRRSPSRSVRRGRLSGRRRHVAQHERQRGAGEPRRRDCSAKPRGTYTTGSPERSRQHGTVDQRRVPGGDASGAAARPRPPRRRGPRSRRRASRERPTSSPTS